MEREQLEHLVDDLFERSDRRFFELCHRIARYAIQGCENENEGLSQIPPVPVSYDGDDNVAPSSRV